MKEKQSVSSFGCSAPYVVRVFGLPVICACGKCYWCREQSRNGFRELVFKRHVTAIERYNNGESGGDDLPF